MKRTIMKFSLVLSLAILPVASIAYASPINNNKQISIYDKTFAESGQVDLNRLSAEERTILEKRTAEIDAYELKIAAALNKRYELVQNSKQDINSTGLKSQIEKVDAEIASLEIEGEKMGLVRIKPDKEEKRAFIQSSYADDFNFDWLNFTYDTQTGLYLLDAQGQWRNSKWSEDYGCGLGCQYFKTYDVGGYDGFYLASLHRDIAIFNKKFYTIKSDSVSSIEWTAGSQDVGPRGQGWKWQDSVYVGALGSETYNSHRQLGWMYFQFTDGKPSSGTTITLKAETSHTWETTAINGFSFAPWSIGFQWTSSSNHWEKPATKNYTF